MVILNPIHLALSFLFFCSLWVFWRQKFSATVIKNKEILGQFRVQKAVKKAKELKALRLKYGDLLENPNLRVLPTSASFRHDGLFINTCAQLAAFTVKIAHKEEISYEEAWQSMPTGVQEALDDHVRGQVKYRELILALIKAKSYRHQ